MPATPCALPPVTPPFRHTLTDVSAPRSLPLPPRATAAGVALVALAAALWGTDGALRSPLTDGWSSWTIVLYEHVVLTVVVLPLLWRRRHRLRGLSSPAWLSVLAVSWGASALATLAFTEAFARGNPTSVILLQKTQPLWAIAAATLVLGERPLRGFVLFLLPALIGTYLISFGWTAPGDAMTGAERSATLLALAAAALWGSATSLGRRALREVDHGLLTALRFSLALPVLLVLAGAKDALTPETAGAGDAARLLAIALVPGFAAMLLYYRGLVRTPASIATLAELAYPATAVVVNAVFLDTPVDLVQLVGFAVVWASIALLHRAPVRTSRPRIEPPIAVAPGA